MDFSKTETAEHEDVLDKERIEEERRLEFERAHFHESHLRSILKGFTWRIVATSTTVIIAYIVTGEVGIALTVGSIEFLGKILLYYVHERAWEMVPKGTIRVLKKRFFKS
ncbi:MAG: DUF2061 domain-containing protein [Saprospiraceae bacterium]|nr:DUF2061 domain-containing protein [Saprospiraceae bacterium]